MVTKLFADIHLPLKPLLAADAATIQVVEDAPVEAVVEPFFGGYADDFLADLGFDMVDELPSKERVKHA